jgi:hypothetical protein
MRDTALRTATQFISDDEEAQCAAQYGRCFMVSHFWICGVYTAIASVLRRTRLQVTPNNILPKQVSSTTRVPVLREVEYSIAPNYVLEKQNVS